MVYYFQKVGRNSAQWEDQRMRFLKVISVVLLLLALAVVTSSFLYLSWVFSSFEEGMRLPQQMRTENVCTAFEQVAIYDEQVRAALTGSENRVSLALPRLAVEQLWLNASRVMMEGRKFNCIGLDELGLLDYLEDVVNDYGLPSRTKFDPSLIESARLRLRSLEAHSVPRAGGAEPLLLHKYMNFHVITLFPNSFDSYLNESIISRAIEDKKIKVSFYNPRDFSSDKWKRIDQKPYAGGPGMVIQALPTAKAIEKALSKIKKQQPLKASSGRMTKTKIIFFSPSGKQFDTSYAKNTAKKYTDIIFVCGRYEGIDSRVKKIFKMEEVTIGPYVLTGGELPAMILLDCISRQVEGVLGNFNSLEETRIASSDVYTRPEVFEHKGKKYRVPKVLLSGNHAKIVEWKKKKS